MNVIANRYAEALFQIGEEEKLTDMLYQELSEIVNLIKVNQDLFSILKSPVISKKEKISLIDNIFEDKININIKNFLKILIEQDRISFISDISDSYKELLNEKNNILEGFVISAIPMKKEEIKELNRKIAQAYDTEGSDIIIKVNDEKRELIRQEDIDGETYLVIPISQNDSIKIN